MDTFEKYEDIERIAELVDLTGNPYDTADFDEIEVQIIDFLNRHIETYKFTDGTVEKLIPTTDGEIRFIVPRSVTGNNREGKYFYQIRTQETDADYESGIRIRSFVGDCYFLKYAKL